MSQRDRARRDHCTAERKRLSSLIAALLEARGQLGHVVVNFRLFLHIIADAGIRVHDRGVIAAAEHFADID